MISGAEVRAVDQCLTVTDTALNVKLRALFAVSPIITQSRQSFCQLHNGDVEYNI